jgi:multisubunit Na+/H+ antiporter MnhG subunit
MSTHDTTPLASTPPRIRWASIIWGLVFTAAASLGIWIFSDDARRDDLTAWTTSLTPNVIGSIVLLVIGGLVLVLGAIGLIRRAQRRSAA